MDRHEQVRGLPPPALIAEALDAERELATARGVAAARSIGRVEMLRAYVVAERLAKIGQGTWDKVGRLGALEAQYRAEFEPLEARLQEALRHRRRAWGAVYAFLRSDLLRAAALDVECSMCHKAMVPGEVPKLVGCECGMGLSLCAACDKRSLGSLSMCSAHHARHE